MNKFLELTRKEIVNLTNYKKIHVVLGNESCDLDSAISALTYAFFLYNTYTDDKEFKNSILPVPMLNVHHEDFPLKTETKYFLKKNNICCSNLIYRNTIDLTALKNEGRLDLTLVDHHVLPKQDLHLKDCVKNIIDHRPINREELACQNFLIKEDGSCCTLIAELILDANKMMSELAHLLYATIVLDTVNFNPDAKRFTENDIKVTKTLEEKFEIIWGKKQIFDELVHARSDISELTNFQVLQKDFKILDGLPIPGIPKLISEFIKSKDAFEAFKQLCKKFDSKVLVPMGLNVVNGTVYREVGVFSLDNSTQLRNKLVEALKSDKNLNLEEIPNDIEGLVLFKQNNVKMSRKHILPIIKDVLK